MFFKMLSLGNMDNNCYILGDDKSKHALIIDAPAEAGAVLDVLEEEGLKLKFVLLTHSHYDHIGALDEICEQTGAEVMIHAFEEDAVNDPTVNLALYAGAPSPETTVSKTIVDTDVITLGDIDIKVLYTPGHTVGSVCYYTEGMLFSGDTLFLKDIGRCDLPGGDYKIIKESIKKQLYTLPDDTDVFPGHGRATTIGYEKEHNNYVQQDWEYEY
ncbi:MAG: MBL fold metallo-hydrolase [Ruminococcaceae bacterium]|nr:MBL fold metallo-hydrolase [Oscillospiraceae bacterium]